MRHTLIIPEETRIHLAEYLTSLQAGNVSAGKRLRDNLAGIELATLTEAAFLDTLLNTKPPQIFAESAVAGDGSDWNLTDDPFSECSNIRQEIHGISLLVRPLLQGNAGKSQLCPPSAFAKAGDDFFVCILFSIVAWDHVSWPGNDFFGGSRCTDDGVKAAATDSMAVLTGIEGHYDRHRGAYLPPVRYLTWDEVVRQNGLRL